MQTIIITNIVDNNVSTRAIQVDADITRTNGQKPLSENDIDRIIGEKTNPLDNRVNVLLYVNKQSYFDAYARSQFNPDGLWDHNDFVHDLAFKVGTPIEPSINILGANEYDFLVEYSSLFTSRLF